MTSYIAVVLLACLSQASVVPGKNETIVYSCPETAHFIKLDESDLTSPTEYARNRHLVSGPRDDRMPPVVKKAEPKKKLAKSSKKSKKGKKSKHKKQRA